MGAQRYDLRKAPDRTRTVFNVFTGLTCEREAFRAVGLPIEEANDLIDLVNGLNRKRRADRGDLR
ncbi:hypothetical protein EN943_08210 [Mesorhizobium sp. M7A.F.Ca.US.006.01.1.1]|nr:hypothetical protein EN943_08210 [Mesorhizobium sp. M7A.F.Ca.US.006.01.1.1]